MKPGKTVFGRHDHFKWNGAPDNKNNPIIFSKFSW